ncbi:MAG TPA: hypothetical protein PK711_12030 [Bacteroidales bacterium]|nr:hypothetical protein [Bacteroidales bacterium]HRZ21974.1 hypothetical protein [Bacteroidales bacterium]
MSSILMVNSDVPLFEEVYGKHDYDWILSVTEKYACKEVPPVVIRYINEKNLSLDPVYRSEDFDFMLSILQRNNNMAGIKRLHGTRARYDYKMGNYKQARYYFLRADRSWKVGLYFLTSFVPPLARIITRKFKVF